MIPEYVGAQAMDADGNGVGTGVTFTVAFDGGAFAAPANVPAHTGDGYWRVQLTAAERENAQADVKVSGGTAKPQVRTFANIPEPVGTAPIDEAADGQVVTSGTVVAGSFADTGTQNATYFQIAVAAGALDVELYYDLPADRIAQGIIFDGRFAAGAGGQHRQDHVRVQAYNYARAAFEDLRNLVNSESEDVTFALTVPRDMTAPAGDPNPGRVRLRFLLGAGDNGDDLFIDRLVVSAVLEQAISIGDLITAMRATIPELVYQRGGVWADTQRGSPGRIIGFNGTPFGSGGQGPVDNVADAMAIAAQLNTRTLYLAGDSKFTLDAGIADGTIIGEAGASLTLGGQDISSADIIGCLVDGAGTFVGTPATFRGCTLVNATCSGHFVDCRLPAGVSLILNSTLNVLDNCLDFEPGTTGVATIDCAGLAGLELKINDFTGHLKLINVAADAKIAISDLDGYLDISDASVNAAAQFTLAGVHDFIGTPRGVITDVARISQTAPMTIIPDQNTVATNMRGTDGAVTSLAGVALEATAQEIKAQTDKMNFTGADIQSIASNMRGTDGASTHDPAAAAAAVAALVIEGTITLEEVLRLVLAADGGVLEGAATAQIRIKSQDGQKDRVTMTVDADGNRSNPVLDLS